MKGKQSSRPEGAPSGQLDFWTVLEFGKALNLTLRDAHDLGNLQDRELLQEATQCFYPLLQAAFIAAFCETLLAALFPLSPAIGLQLNLPDLLWLNNLVMMSTTFFRLP